MPTPRWAPKLLTSEPAPRSIYERYVLREDLCYPGTRAILRYVGHNRAGTPLYTIRLYNVPAGQMAEVRRGSSRKLQGLAKAAPLPTAKRIGEQVAWSFDWLRAVGIAGPRIAFDPETGARRYATDDDCAILDAQHKV